MTLASSAGHQTQKVCGVQDNETEHFEDDSTTVAYRNNGNCLVKVLFVYTPTVPDLLASVENRVEQILATANLTLANSGILPCHLEFTLAGIEEWQFDETERDEIEILTQLRSDNVIQQLRNNYNADIVYGLVNRNIAEFTENVSGIAFLGPNNSTAYGIGRAVGNGAIHTAVHEIGHIMGGNHEPCSAFDPGENCLESPVNENHAHTFQFEKTKGIFPFCHTVTLTRKTTMFSELSDDRIEHFSNPDVLFEGQPTGIESERDNANTLKTNACTVAAFRTSVNPFVSITGQSQYGCGIQELCLNMSDIEEPVTWSWSYSPDGITFIPLHAYDNDPCITAYFHQTFGGVRFYRVTVFYANGTSIFGNYLMVSSCPPPAPQLGYDASPIQNFQPKGIRIAPNPVNKNQIATLTFEVVNAGVSSWKLLSSSGAVLSETTLGYLDAGIYQEQVLLPDGYTGLYWILLNANGKTERVPFIYQY